MDKQTSNRILPSSVVRTDINMKQQSADFEKDGQTKRTKRKANPEHNLRKNMKMPGCEPQKRFEGDRLIRRLKRRLKEHREGLPSSLSANTDKGTLSF